MTENINAAVTHVMDQLTDEDIAYAADPERGEDRGFWGIPYDSNDLLPDEVVAAVLTEENADGIEMYNRVVAGVTAAIIARSNS